MGLDPGFELRGKAVDSQRALGNGITFNVGRALALAAQRKPITLPHQTSRIDTASVCSDESEGEDGDSLAHCVADMERLVKRMRKFV